MERYCKMCKKPIKGRTDKIFCSIGCKNQYNIKLARVTREATKKIDDLLHRNRSILLEILGKNITQKKINKLILDKKNFKYDYITGFHVNKNNKTVFHVYDFSWLIFSDEEVLIIRKRNE